MKPAELMLRYLEGAASDADAARLSESVRTDPAARRELAELMVQDTLLARVARESEFRVAPPSRRSWLLPAAAAVALLTVSAVVLLAALRGPRSQPSLGRPSVAPIENPVPPPVPMPAATEPQLPPQPLIAPVKPPRIPPLPAAPDRAQGQARSDLRPPLPPLPVQPWEVVIAKIEQASGEVAVLSGPLRVAAKPGQNLTWGLGLETGPDPSSALLRFSDSTCLELGPDTVLRESSDRPGERGEEAPKRVHLKAGTLTVHVAAQPPGQPMAFITPHVEAKFAGARFKLVVEAESTRLEMIEGWFRAARKGDRAPVHVAAGHFVVFAKGLPLEAKPIK